ncbi:MAG: phosphotransferase [Lactococcus cremoris]
MIMDNDIQLLTEEANELSHILNRGNIVSAQVQKMEPYEQGFSGASLLRLKVLFADGQQGSFIGKKADLKERMVMRTLTEQGHHHTPAAYCENLTSDEAQWMVEEDLGKQLSAPSNRLQWLNKVAAALAEIYGNNMNRGKEMAWLTPADAEYWNKIVGQLSVDHFEKAISDDYRFAQQFEGYLPKVKEKAALFAKNMIEISQEEEWLTLTHGDLQNVEGNHVYNIQGNPYIIDFGFSSYAPFYIDLVDYFSADEAILYHKALIERGFSLELKDFEERFKAAILYPCFIYMFPSMMDWKRGNEEKLMKLIYKIVHD